MKTYVYDIERPSALVTTIGAEGPMPWVLEQMNEIGAQGKRIIGPPVEFQEPGTVSDAQGRPIPYYGVVLFTEEEVEVEAETDEEPF